MIKKILKSIKNKSFIKDLKKEIEKSNYIIRKYLILKKIKIKKVENDIVYLELETNEGHFNAFTFENEFNKNKIKDAGKFLTKITLIKPIESNFEIFKKYYYLSDININYSSGKKGSKSNKNIKGDVDDVGIDTLVNLGEI